ncbi:DUF2029 domain-containing protein [bacterium]|nr:DUF2029 domain-containing protein [bacterium]
MDTGNDSFVYDWKTWALYGVLAACIAILPLLMACSGLPSIGSSCGKSYQVFELFGFCSMAALAVVAYVEIKRRRSAGLVGIVSVVLFVLVFSHMAMLISECTRKTGDYECYRSAAEKVLAGQNPYSGTGYLYPPVLAEAMAGVHQALVGITDAIGARASDADICSSIFYLWQCAQFFLAIAAYLLSVRFVKVLGGKGILPVLLVAAVFVFDIPLIRTLRWNQANLLMLVAILYVLAMGKKRPFLAGAVLALGVCIKLYPVVLLLPVIITRRWRTLAGFAVAMFAIIALDVGLRRNFDIWLWYLDFFRGFPSGFPVFSTSRDNSLYNIIVRSAWFMSTGVTSRGAFVIALLLWRLSAIAALIYTTSRIVVRERSFALQAKTCGDIGQADTIRFTGHAVDLLALALVLSPLVWEHHYVLAVPVILWAIICQHRRRPWLVGLGSMLILLPPSFDVWPFSFHRIVGLAMLIVSSLPVVDLAEHQKNIKDLQVFG